MPSAFTHAFVGAALTPLAPPGMRRIRLVVELAAVSVLPDLDVMAFGLGIPYAHPVGHRGLSHSIAFAALLALLVPLVLHRDVRPWSDRWWGLAALFFAACASHGLLDACTDGGLGVGLFIPFSNARVFFPWRPLAVSPLEPSAFFTAWGWMILRTEILWVWIPVAAAVTIAVIVRRMLDGRSHHL
jgi:inner membrane protein